jgi:hypothetical protein
MDRMLHPTIAGSLIVLLSLSCHGEKDVMRLYEEPPCPLGLRLALTGSRGWCYLNPDQVVFGHEAARNGGGQPAEGPPTQRHH